MRTLYRRALVSGEYWDVPYAPPVYHGVTLCWSIDVAARYASDLVERVFPLYAKCLDPMPINEAILYARGWSSNADSWCDALVNIVCEAGETSMRCARAAHCAALVRYSETIGTASHFVELTRFEALCAKSSAGAFDHVEYLKWYRERLRLYLFGLESVDEHAR